MANEAMTILEQYDREVILVIRTGLTHAKNISQRVVESLKEWCDSHEEYQVRIRQAKETNETPRL